MYNENVNFALWCDFVERNFLENEFKDLLNDGVINGATSNPAIFKSAFSSSDAYKEDKDSLKGKHPKDVYEAMAIKDIQKAADIMSKSHEKGDDGFISIEVDPHFCDDARATFEEGKRLYDAIKRDNVMIKVPATKAGYEAMEMLMREGIHINSTLVFSKKQAYESLQSMQRGSSKFEEDEKPKGVISVFVSRFDRLLDDRLQSKGLEVGKAGIYNALDIYDMIESHGHSNIRALFASTGVKGDSYAPDYYVSELLVPNSVNTAPLDTIKAFLDTKKCTVAQRADKDSIQRFFSELKVEGIDIEDVSNELLEDGLGAFKSAFKEILDSLK